MQAYVMNLAAFLLFAAISKIIFFCEASQGLGIGQNAGVYIAAVRCCNRYAFLLVVSCSLRCFVKAPMRFTQPCIMMREPLRSYE